MPSQQAYSAAAPQYSTPTQVFATRILILILILRFWKSVEPYHSSHKQRFPALRAQEALQRACRWRCVKESPYPQYQAKADCGESKDCQWSQNIDVLQDASAPAAYQAADASAQTVGTQAASAGGYQGSDMQTQANNRAPTLASTQASARPAYQGSSQQQTQTFGLVRLPSMHAAI